MRVGVKIFLAGGCREEVLVEFINVCSHYARHHDIIYNTQKTACMVVSANNVRYMQCDNFVLNNVQLQYVDEFKYLGHEKANNLKDNDDINKQLRKLNTIGNIWKFA